MKVIGITGGVGAGKSRILDLLKEEYGAQVVQADEIAKGLEDPGQPGYDQLVKLFGKDILSEDGTIDRGLFAGRIFQDEEVLRAVNAVIHPMTWHVIQDKIHQSHSDLVVVEAALFDADSKQICDELWLIDATEKTRISRLQENRGYTEDKARSIMENQPSREAFLKLADKVIDNNGTIVSVQSQIRRLLKEETNETN